MTVCNDIDCRFDNLSGSHCLSQVNCVSTVDELTMLSVVCQLSRYVIGCELPIKFEKFVIVMTDRLLWVI